MTERFMPTLRAPPVAADWWTQDARVLLTPQQPQGDAPWWLGDVQADQIVAQPPIAQAALPEPDPVVSSYTADALSGDPARARPAIDHELRQQQARREVDAEKAAGLSNGGAARLALQGATFNTADEVLAAAMAVPTMFTKGLSYGDAYALAKAKEDMRLEDARAEHSVSGAVGQALGGVFTGGALAKAGASAIPALSSRLGGVAGTALGGAIDGTVLGAASGFADGNSLDQRLGRAKFDAALGGAVGGALPLAIAAAKPVLAPIASNVSARVNPTAYAERQAARAMERSGQTADQVADRLGQAAIEGQGEYRLLDALDYPGARLGAVVGKNPGQGRTELRTFLNQRQEGQGYRIGNILSEGLGADETAQAAAQRMTAARKAMDDEAFSAVRQDAGPVDVGPAVRAIDDVLNPVFPPSGKAIEALERLRTEAQGFRGTRRPAHLPKTIGQTLDDLSKALSPDSIGRANPERDALIADLTGYLGKKSTSRPAKFDTFLRDTLDMLRPTAIPQLEPGVPNNIAYDSVEGALSRARGLLTDGSAQISNFGAVQRARRDIADIVQKADRAGEGNKARLTGNALRALDAEMQKASGGYRDAMARSAQAARDIEAIDAGKIAATRGRSEDKVAAFGFMPRTGQQAFRTGFADTLIERAQKGASGADKSRPLTSLAMRTELPAFGLPGKVEPMTRQLGRETEMFANRNQALGGSTTAENLADSADTGIDAGIFAKLFTGQFGGALRDALTRGAAGLSGNTETVRNELARILMNGSPEEVRALFGRLSAASERRGDIGAGAFRGLLAGGLPALSTVADQARFRQVVGTSR